MSGIDDDKKDKRGGTGSGGSHQTDSVMPSEVALELALKRRAEARARDKDEPRAGGKRHRKFGKR